MASPSADLDESLLSFEKLDRASPDLWPERIPGVSDFVTHSPLGGTGSPAKWELDLKGEDVDMLQELGSLTKAQLMEKVRALQNLAYQLGLDEAHEMTRGKYLNILERSSKRH